MYSGKCLCGEIQISIEGPIRDIIHCHCSLCRKNSGTAYATNGFVELNDFTLVKGSEKLSVFSFKPGRFRHFCMCCGSPVYSSNEQDPYRIRIRLGILDSDIIERSLSHNFVSSKANWDNLNANIPRYDAVEPSRK